MPQNALHSPVPNQRNPYLVLIANQSSKNTRESYARCLRNIAGIFNLMPEVFPWHQLDTPKVLTIRARLLEVYPAPATINLHLSALSQVLHTAWMLEYIDSDKLARMREACKLLPVRGQKAGRYITTVEVRKMLDTCGSSENDIRDRIILHVLYLTGLRVSELCNLRWGDYRPDTGELLIKGKGDKHRSVFLPLIIRSTLNGWMLLTRERSDWIFHTARGKQIGRSHLKTMLVNRAKLAGIESLTTHDFRRSFISNGFDNPKMDIATLQRIVGHSRADTTVGYDRRPEHKIRDVMEDLEL